MIRIPMSAVLITLLTGPALAAPANFGAGSGGEAGSARAPQLVLVANGAFDGSYAGTVINVKQSSNCGKMNSWHGTFSVMSNHFTTNIGRYALTGDVHPDGSFETTADMGLGGRNAFVHFSGHITGDTVHATGRSPLCQWDMDMHK